jgi:hypothetical protein
MAVVHTIEGLRDATKETNGISSFIRKAAVLQTTAKTSPATVSVR